MREKEITEMEFIEQRAQLRKYAQDIRKGKIVIEDVPAEYRVLLMKFYGL